MQRVLSIAVAFLRRYIDREQVSLKVRPRDKAIKLYHLWNDLCMMEALDNKLCHWNVYRKHLQFCEFLLKLLPTLALLTDVISGQ